MMQQYAHPAGADFARASPFDAEPVAEADLWFLPGPDDDLDRDPLAPPGPRADQGEAYVLAEWRAAQGHHAAALARVASIFGALDERLRGLGQGARHRLALLEAGDISWQCGDRVAPDRLALWVSLRLVGAQDDVQALARAAWATRRLSGGPGQGPEADLAGFLGRQEVERPAGIGGGFGEPPTDLAGRLADWQGAMRAAEGLHPIVTAALGFHLWRLAGISGAGPAADLEAAVVAARLAARAGRGGAVFLPLALAGPGSLRRGGTVTDILGRWLAGAQAACRAALLQLERLADWRGRAEAATAGWSGRTPARLIAVLADWPLVSAPLAEGETGASRAAVQRNLDRLGETGLIREVTGQGRYRLWCAKL